MMSILIVDAKLLQLFMEQRRAVNNRQERTTGEGATKQRVRRRSGTQTVAKKTEERKFFYRRASVGLYCAAVFLLPSLFVPAVGFGLNAAKVPVLAILVLLSLATYFLSRSKEKVYLPASFFMILGVIGGGLFLSTIFSNSFHASFLGADFEVGTFYTLLLGIFFAITGALVISSQARFMAFFTAFFGGVGAVVLIHLLRFVFGAENLTFGVFSSATSTPVGSWSDLGVFMGVVLLVSAFVISLGNLPKKISRIFAAFLFVALGFVALVNLKALLIVLAVFVAVILVLVFMSGGSAKGVSALVILGSLVLLLSFGGVVASLIERTGVVDPNIGPNFRGTSMVIGENMSIKNVLVGNGPNTFVNLWQKERSPEVLVSDVWALDFSSGVSNMATFFVTHGVIVVLGFLFLLGYLVQVFWRAQGRSSPDSFSQLVLLTSSFAAIFIFVMSAVLSLGVVPILLGFIFSGVAMGAKMNIARGKVWVLDLRGEIGTLVFGVILVGCVVGAIYSGAVLASKGLYSSALSDIVQLESISPSDADRIDRKLLLATSLSNSDVISRTRTEIAILEMQQIAILSEDELTEERMNQFEHAFNRAEESSEKAIRANPRNYLNWISRGFVLENVALLQIQDTFAAAAQSYEQARKENPTNPEIPLIQARLELAQGKVGGAEVFAREAIAMKPNYVGAYTFLANVALGNDEPEKAVGVFEEAVRNMPSDTNVRYQLGVLFYVNDNFEKAIEAFDRVVAVDINHANARYLRALSAFYSGNRTAALADLEYVLRTNEENENLKKVIENIKEGRDALGGVEDAGAGLLEDLGMESFDTGDFTTEGVLESEESEGVAE